VMIAMASFIVKWRVGGDRWQCRGIVWNPERT
jgi:hypothetical protein